jgi:hypothetical protein
VCAEEKAVEKIVGSMQKPPVHINLTQMGISHSPENAPNYYVLNNTLVHVVKEV